MPPVEAPPPNALLVANPRVLAGVREELRSRTTASLGPHLVRDGVVETLADGANAGRVESRVRAARPAVVIAAGGDGTVAAAAAALLRLDPTGRPALAVLPFGTANNVARSLGLRSIRGEGDLDLALATALRGRERRLDAGRVAGRPFVGSFAAGMDADILRLRNAVSRAVGDRPPLTGYPLYLASCAASLLLRHGGRARIVRDGETAEIVPAYCVLVLNVALYAGEFRFAAGDPSRDGALDLHVFGGAAAYVRAYVAAWRRHLARERGGRVEDPAGLRRVRRVRIDFERPTAAQIDGEELPPAASFEMTVDAGALAVREPLPERPAAGGAAPGPRIA